MSENEIKQLQEKIKSFEKEFAHLHFVQFAYLHSILALLDDKNITTAQEFREYLEKYKKELTQKMKDADFLKTVSEQFKKNKE